MNTVFISGVSKGIGKALAMKFLNEGYFVIGTSTSGEVDIENTDLKVLTLDLSSSKSIEDCVDGANKLGKKINIHINNAGAIFDEDETVIVIEKLRKTLEVNLIGTIDLTERLIPMLDIGGHIVNVSSSAGSLEETGHHSHFLGHYPSYKISKAALNMYTRTLALRLKDQVTVSSVHPGWVQTQMGGAGANITPDEAAANIYKLAISRPDSGYFWFNGEMMPW
ncbi:MAG: SDR family NAD(P)-dependent oxidoreductase [Candidatus Taylorbacteria bacterium]